MGSQPRPPYMITVTGGFGSPRGGSEFTIDGFARRIRVLPGSAHDCCELEVVNRSGLRVRIPRPLIQQLVKDLEAFLRRHPPYTSEQWARVGELPESAGEPGGA